MSDIKYTDEMVEEIIKEIPEGIEEKAAQMLSDGGHELDADISAVLNEAAFVKEEQVSASKKPKKKYEAKKAIGKNVDVKCSSSNREASYDSEAQQLTITQNGITIMVSPCKTEKQAIRLAAKF
tara:strand:- start:16 stop:387 length:372 start_codon:yes stop_codon:yes gene_type:complete